MFRLSRRPLRKITSIKAQMRVGEDWTEVRLANVSARGLMVKCPQGVDLAPVVEIRHRGVTITGQVVWTTPTRFGLTSFVDIDLAALTAQSDLQLDRRLAERAPPTNRRVRAR